MKSRTVGSPIPLLWLLLATVAGCASSQPDASAGAGPLAGGPTDVSRPSNDVAPGGGASEAGGSGQTVTQVGSGLLTRADVLQREYPELDALLTRIERARGVLYKGLFEEGEAVRASGDDIPTFGFEFDMVDRLTFLVQGEGKAEEDAADAEAGYLVFGERGAAVLHRAYDFYRELVAIYVDPSVTDIRATVDDLVQRYESEPEIALPLVPKDMDIMYDHPYTWAFRTGYLDLGGFVWAGRWFKLAVTEPLMCAARILPCARTFDTREELLAGIDTVRTRYYSKLTYGEPPEFFPEELPLSQPIVPMLTSAHQDAAIILDNVAMLQDVLSDVLSSAEVEDVDAAIGTTLDWFLDPTYRITDRYDWMAMALRHSIFLQGGPPLGIMTQSERNTSGHAQHFSGGGGPVILPGMPGG